MSEDEMRHRRNCALFELQVKRRELEEVRMKQKELQEKLESFPQREAELHKKIKEVQSLCFSAEMLHKRQEADRAVEKAERAERAVLQKKAQVEKLKEEAAQMSARKQELQREVEKHSVYKDFLDQAVKFTKFEDTDALVNHFEKLLHFRETLYQKETEAQEKQSQQRKRLQEMEEQHKLLVLVKNNELKQLQVELDRTRAEADAWEKQWNHIQETAAKKALELGQIRMATLNLYEKTGGKVGGEDGLDMQDTEKQLDQIKVFILENTDIMKQYQASLRKDEEQKQDKAKKPNKHKVKNT